MLIRCKRDLRYLGAFLGLCCLVGSLWADEEKSKADGEQGAATAENGESPIELVERLRQLNRQTPKGDTREEMFENYRQTQEETLQIAQQLYQKTIAAKDAKELNFAAIALQAKFRATMILGRLQENPPAADPFLRLADEGEALYKATQGDGDFQAAGMSVQIVVETLRAASLLQSPDAEEKLKKFLEQVSQDSRRQVAAFAKQQLLQAQLQLTPSSDKAAVDRVVGILETEYADRAVEAEDVQVIMEVLSQVEQLGQIPAAIRLSNFFADKFSQSDNQQIKQFASMLSGTARRLELPGKGIELSGTFLDGSPLDWASYRGKVVLVDFWATWCKPCIKGLPKVQEVAEQYASKGVQVFTINVDGPRNRPKVRPFMRRHKIELPVLFLSLIHI